MIQLADPAREHAALATDIEAAALRVLRSGRYILGEEVERFERDFAACCGTKHAVGVSNGSDAIVVALHALGVGAGDDVVTTAFSYLATAGAIVRTGARPVFADIDLGTLNVDPRDLERRLTPRTKAVLAVHLFGRCANTDALAALCDARGIALVEDAAQACGAERKRRRSGSLGRIGCFSFFPAKPLGAAGDAGACTTDDAGLAAAMRRARFHGAERKNFHTGPGSNYRLDPLQAAILGVKLAHLETRLARRRANAERLRQLLAPLRTRMVLPEDDALGRHVYAQFTVRVPSAERDRFAAALRERGVASEVYYPLPMPLQPVFAPLGGKPGDWPASERAAREVVSIPVHPELTDAEVDHVARAVLEVGGELPAHALDSASAGATA